jgi:hypothetical protein
MHACPRPTHDPSLYADDFPPAHAYNPFLPHIRNPATFFPLYLTFQFYSPYFDTVLFLIIEGDCRAEVGSLYKFVLSCAVCTVECAGCGNDAK